MEAIQAFLKEYDHIPPNEKCMALLLAEERFLKIKQVRREQKQPEVLQELLLKLINDLQILKEIQQEKKKPTAQSSIPYWNSSMIDDEEARDNFLKDVCTFLRKFSRIPFGITPKSFTEYINCPSWNRPLFYFDDDDDEYTVIWRRPKAITPDLPIEESENSLIMGDEPLSTIPETESDEVIKSSVENLVPIPSEFEGISDDICDEPVCDDSSTFDALNDNSEILSKSNNDDVILREKLLNVHRLISNIESLKVNSTPDRVLESPFPFPIPVADSDSFLEESDTSLSYLDNSLPRFETFSDILKRQKWHIDNLNNTLLELPEFESFHFDPSFPRPPPEPPDVEICLNFESVTPVIDNFEELNEDQSGSENVLFQNVEDDDTFTLTICIFLPFLTLPQFSLYLAPPG
ncbi:hypothetical protein Tco_1538086 [Tanacetum coccineum]